MPSYRWAHHALLTDLPPPTGSLDGCTVDAVVTATNRDPNARPPGIALGAELAAAHGAEHVVVCSGASSAAGARRAFRELERSTVIDAPPDLQDRLCPLRTSQHRLSRFHRRNDVGAKRNLGLALAAARGWRSVLFLDDDILVDPADSGSLTSGGLATAVSSVDADPSLRAVGWATTDFPDNSVLGHGRRLAGQPQSVFIGSGALLVPTARPLSFFPAIYNEDWLFLMGQRLVSDGRWGRAGSVHQLRYRPFRVERAASEEGGDLLAEHLLTLMENTHVEAGHRGPAAERDEFVRRATSRLGLAVAQRDRGDVVDECLTGLGRASYAISDAGAKDARLALEEARRVLGTMTPHCLTSYVEDWVEDQQRWTRFLSDPVAVAEAVAVVHPSLSLQPMSSAAV